MFVVEVRNEVRGFFFGVIYYWEGVESFGEEVIGIFEVFVWYYYIFMGWFFLCFFFEVGYVVDGVDMFEGVINWCSWRGWGGGL